MLQRLVAYFTFSLTLVTDLLYIVQAIFTKLHKDTNIIDANVYIEQLNSNSAPPHPTPLAAQHQ